MILLIGGEKGGVGKSTIACNLLAYLVHLNKDVLQTYRNLVVLGYLEEVK